jgi:plastocyanin
MRAHTHFWLALVLTTGITATFPAGARSQQIQQRDRTTNTGEGAKQDDSSAKDAGAEKKAAISVRYKSELAKLKDAAAGSMNECLNATYIAARDAQVQVVLIRKLLNSDYVFKGVRCLDDPGIPEQERVLFDFDCKPGIFCLVDPNVLVIVDIIDGRVIDIIDPYIGGSHRTAIHRADQTFNKRRAAVHRISVSSQDKKFIIDGDTSSLNKPIRIPLGDSVIVTFNSGGGTHDWSLDYGSQHMKVEDGETSPPFTADTAGTFEYYCSVDSHRAQDMKGPFIVDP